MANVTTSKTVYVLPVSQNNPSISHEDAKKFRKIHVTASKMDNDAFLREDKPSLT